jgi:hypothetical protein
MRIHAEDLAVGDILVLHDWNLHIIEVERDRAVTVLTAEFGFSLHFVRNEAVDVQEGLDAA